MDFPDPPVTASPRPELEAASYALVLLNRYTVGLNAIVARTLGDSSRDNRRVEMLVTIRRDRGITPSALAERLGISRSIAARHISALVDDGLVLRRRSRSDGRSHQLVLTARGTREMRRFARELTTYFTAQAPAVKDALQPWSADEHSDDAADFFVVIAQMARSGAALAASCTARLTAMGVDLSWPERAALSFLLQAGEARPSRLAEEIGLSRQGTSDLLDRLEEGGFVRRADPEPGEDGRTVHVSVTDLGSEVAVAMSEAMAEHGRDISAALAPTTVWLEHRP